MKAFTGIPELLFDSYELVGIKSNIDKNDDNTINGYDLSIYLSSRLIEKRVGDSNAFNHCKKIVEDVPWYWIDENIIMNLMNIDYIQHDQDKESGVYTFAFNYKDEYIYYEKKILHDSYFGSTSQSLISAFEAAIAERKRLNEIAGRI